MVYISRVLCSSSNTRLPQFYTKPRYRPIRCESGRRIVSLLFFSPIVIFAFNPAPISHALNIPSHSSYIPNLIYLRSNKQLDPFLSSARLPAVKNSSNKIEHEPTCASGRGGAPRRHLSHAASPSTYEYKALLRLHSSSHGAR